jgi:hypothetical protein
LRNFAGASVTKAAPQHYPTADLICPLCGQKSFFFCRAEITDKWFCCPKAKCAHIVGDSQAGLAKRKDNDVQDNVTAPNLLFPKTVPPYLLASGMIGGRRNQFQENIHP